MVTDQNEKNRKLTPAEKRRLAAYEVISQELEGQGYRRTELTVGIVKANIFAMIMGIPVAVIGFILFLAVNWGRDIRWMSGNMMLLIVLAMLVLIVVHELIHGITWALFADHHFGDIEFGFMKEYLTPYCTCKCPLTKGKYIIGALMPLLILGLLPMAVGIGSGSFFWLLLGIIMTVSAGGDIMIVMMIMKYKSQAEDILYLDHPTQAGGVIFEKKHQ